jgi:hypothetical protein
MADVIRAVGDFSLAEARIITSSGTEINVKQNIVGLNLFEDCQRNAISGEVLIQDSGDFVGLGPIIGQEYFLLKIQTPSLKSEGDIIDYTKNVFIINSIQNRTEAGNNVSMYLLTFTTSELVKNKRTRVNESLNGTYSDIVEDMLKRVNCQKQIFIEPTNGVKRIVAPNISPFKVISMALKQSTSSLTDNASPSYMFYETFKGYHFRTLASMYAQPISQTYTTYVPGSQVNKGIVNIETQLGNIIDYEIVDNSNSLFNFTTGVYGSKLIVHNIYSKSFTEYNYNYFDNFSKERHITNYHGKKQFPIFSDVAIEKGGSRSSDFPSRTYLTSISQGETDTNNTTIDGTEPFAAPDPQNSIQERASTMNQLEKGLLLNIVTHGNTSVNAGDVVIVDIPHVASVKKADNPKNDRFYQGVFLVKRIKHEFNFTDKKHTTYMTLVKDSLAKKLDGPKDLHEPKPEKNGSVFRNKETFYPQL